MLRAAVALLALVLLAGVLQDAFEVMLLPRRVDRRVRLASFYFRAAWAGWRRLAGLLPQGRRRIAVLGVFGPLSMVVLFALWAALLVLAFGSLEWAAQGRAGAASFADQLYMSGATFFTLGYGDVVPHARLARALAVIEAGTGLGFIAAVIGYLPVLYQLFSRRESHVIRLDARAGSPATGAAMLALHAELGGLPTLDALFEQWEILSAELLESHLSYPMLVFYRSQHDDQSWLAAMAAVMDACALILAGIEGMPPLQARMTFTMGRSVLVELCRMLPVRPAGTTAADRLPRHDFDRLAALLRDAGIGWRDADAAEQDLRALRVTYEPLLVGLAALLSLPLHGWLPAADTADHWHRGHLGDHVRRTVTRLAAAGGTDRGDGEAPPGR